MKSINNISKKIESIKSIYDARISKLHEKRNEAAKFKLKKIASMAARGKDITSAGDRLVKFLERSDEREKHHLKNRDKRISDLNDKKALLFIREKERNFIRNERRLERKRVADAKSQLIHSEKEGWKKGNKYRKERNQLIWNLNKRRRARIIKTAHNGMAIDYGIDNSTNMVDPVKFLESCKQETLRVIVPKHVPSKTRLKIECIFTQNNLGNDMQNFLSTKTFLVQHGSDFESEWEYCKEDLIRKLHNFMRKKSGWRIKRIVRLIICTNKFVPNKGGSFVEIPKSLAAKKALINIQNDDQECFKWAITRSLFEPTTNLKKPGKVTKELIENSEKLNWENVSFPACRKDYKTFETKNKEIGLIVYTMEGKEIVPVYVTKKQNCKKAYIFAYKNHYLTITSLSRLLSKPESAKHKNHVCERCTRCFLRESSLEIHKRYCENFDYEKLTFPEKEPFVKFKNYRRMQKNFLTIYADFECYQEKESIIRGSKSELIMKHIPCAWGIYECRLDGKNQYHEYVGKNAEETFIEKLDEITKKFYQEFKIRKPINLSGIKSSDSCWVCKKEFKKGECMVNDHNHFTGEFRGKAHKDCNLLLRRNLDFIPVFIHNLAGYDEKLFIRKLGRNVKIIAKNDESFISFSNCVKVDEYFDEKGVKKDIEVEVRFLDSFKFLSGSLNNLSKNLKPEQFKNTNKYFEKPEKGIFPYEYLDSLEKLNDKELPPHINFFSLLQGKNISAEEYELAKKAWEKYRCKSLKDYLRIYMKMDVVLLADVMENFRITCMKFYDLDPTWYYTVPGFAWDCCLKFTGQTLELMTEENAEILLFIECGIRGGISCITKRYSKANNPYMGKKYDPEKPSKYILYLDANNLYGWAMSKKLPIGNFKWMNNWELENWNSDDWGCILEVDLEYPEELHNLHNDLPLAPERMESKLIPNLKNKERYIVHKEMLKTCLDLGLKLKKIHRGVKFKEKAWLKPYIDFNTEKRMKAKSEFEKDFFKLMNNAVFGKTMENVRNRINVRIASNLDFESYVRKVNFERRTILNEEKSIIHLRELSIKMNKPLYVGMSILDISKTLIYNFHYKEVLGKQFPNAELLFTDTDSLCYEIEAEDVYKTMAENVKEWYDTSGYSPDFKTLDGKKFPSGKNKKVIGYMKDEENGNIITAFGGIRSKCYAYETKDKTVKKAKGIKKNIIKKDITFKDYEKCILEKKSLEVEVIGFRSLKHEIHTEKMTKKALEHTDTKRKVLEDGIHTRAWGHYLN